MVFVLMWLWFAAVSLVCALKQNSTITRSEKIQSNTTLTRKPLRIAYCLTGQLARLELRSKVRNIFAVNARLGHEVHVMALLDNEIDKVKQTFWRFDYSNTPYRNHTESMLIRDTYSLLAEEGLSEYFTNKIRLFVTLGPPSQDEYQVVGESVPVSDKLIHKPADKHGRDSYPKEGIEKAEIRFQNNMRWLGALRDCMKWVQKLEYQQRKFYDLVVRLREDTYVFAPWKISEFYLQKLSSAGSASFRGINDHNFVVDRQYADDLFRGLIEDYYMNRTLKNEFWGNPEHRIYQVAVSYNIPIQNITVCQQPLLPLRGMHDPKHWLAHTVYARQLLDECYTYAEIHAPCTCSDKWLRMLKASILLIEF